MEKKIYYFQQSYALSDLVNNPPQRFPGRVEHYSSYSDAWFSGLEKPIEFFETFSKLGCGPNLDVKVTAPYTSVIFGESVSPLFMWANRYPSSFVGEIQAYNIANAQVQFPYDILHGPTSETCYADETGKIDYTPAFVIAFTRWKELDSLAKAIDKTSEECRAKLDLTDPATHWRLRDIYTHGGSCHLQTPDLVSLLTMHISQRIIDELPLEFTLHLQEFQHLAHHKYMNYAMEISEKPTSIEKKALDSIQGALDWMDKAVKNDGMCQSEEAWKTFEKIRDEVARQQLVVSVEPNTQQSVYLVEHRELGQYVNRSVENGKELPAFASWSEMNQYIQKEAAKLEKEDPTNTGYFMIYRGIAHKVSPMMSIAEVGLSHTEVYMLGNGIFNTTTYTVPSSIGEQERRLNTWETIKEFAGMHEISPLSILDLPARECAEVRDAFVPGGFMHDEVPDVSQYEGRPELHPLGYIQQILCGERADFESVHAAIVIGKSYQENLQAHLLHGETRQQAMDYVTRLSLQEAAYYTQHRPELHNIFKDCLDAENIYERLEEIAENEPQYPTIEI